MSLINSLDPWSYEDKLTGNKLKLEVTPYYLKLSVNDREFTSTKTQANLTEQLYLRMAKRHLVLFPILWLFPRIRRGLFS